MVGLFDDKALTFVMSSWLFDWEGADFGARRAACLDSTICVMRAAAAGCGPVFWCCRLLLLLLQATAAAAAAAGCYCCCCELLLLLLRLLLLRAVACVQVHSLCAERRPPFTS